MLPRNSTAQLLHKDWAPSSGHSAEDQAHQSDQNCHVDLFGWWCNTTTDPLVHAHFCVQVTDKLYSDKFRFIANVLDPVTQTHKCTGVLIKPDTVLAPASCLEAIDGELPSVRIGSYDINGESGQFRGEVGFLLFHACGYSQTMPLVWLLHYPI